MKKLMILTLAVALAAAGCSSKKEAPKTMAPGTPAYQMAKDLAAVIPSLDPDKLTLLVKTKRFDVTLGDVLQMFLDSMGNQAQGLRGLEPQRIKIALERAGVQVGERRLLLEAAAAAGKTALQADVDKALQGQYARAGSEAQYLELLKTNGVSLDYIKTSITEDLTIRAYLESALAESSKVTDAEVQKAYQEDKTATVRHVLLLTQGKTPAEKAEVRKKMEGVLERARKGEDFAALAKEFTEDPGSKENGGLYEDFPRGRMVKPFEDAAFTVPVGQISGIVETTYGYHILKIENRKKESQPLDQVKPQIESGLKEQKKNAAFDVLLTGLKKKAGFEPVPIVLAK